MKCRNRIFADSMLFCPINQLLSVIPTLAKTEEHAEKLGLTLGNAAALNSMMGNTVSVSNI